MDRSTAQDQVNQGNQVSNAPSQVSTPVSSPQKEMGPTTVSSGGLERVESKPEISPELGDFGMEAVSGEIEIPKEAKEIGLEPAKENVPVQTEPDGSVSIPLTAQQSLSILKVHKDITEAIVWLATWCLRQLKIKKD